MLMYRVDLTSLEPSERVAAVKRIDVVAFDTYDGYGTSGLEYVDVAWAAKKISCLLPCSQQVAAVLRWATNPHYT